MAPPQIRHFANVTHGTRGTRLTVIGFLSGVQLRDGHMEDPQNPAGWTAGQAGAPLSPGPESRSGCPPVPHGGREPSTLLSRPVVSLSGFRYLLPSLCPSLLVPRAGQRWSPLGAVPPVRPITAGPWAGHSTGRSYVRLPVTSCHWAPGRL